MYVSGQIGLTPAMEFAGDSIEEQTEQVMKNIGKCSRARATTSRQDHHHVGRYE